jgi:hypothetical protein
MTTRAQTEHRVWINKGDTIKDFLDAALNVDGVKPGTG